jgi:anti-sigma-K factor RskA
MKGEHIISLIENSSLASLSESELHAIRMHTADCSNCLKAFEAAQVSLILLKERAAVSHEPSPFFHTRVLATLREQQAKNEGWGLLRLWRTAGLLTSSMAASVVLLGVLTFAIPSNQSLQQEVSVNAYSAEDVILNQNPNDDFASDSQVLSTLYDGEEEAAN